jgi:microsomal dipeptidase-like Zn-dependent dipeptidase
MIAKTADLMGVDHIGFGSDLCQDQPDSIVEWMRVGKWTKEIDYGEGSASNPGFPEMPSWFRDNRDWQNIIQGLKNIGFNDEEVKKIKGENWLNFFKKSFTAISK